MAKANKRSEAAKTVKVAPDLRVAGAAAAYAALDAAARGAERGIVLDAREVEKVDAAGLQAVLAGRRRLIEAGKTVSWAGCSAQMRSAAELLGLAEHLGIAR
jgi:anti-anti-sigma regulatory factor